MFKKTEVLGQTFSSFNWRIHTPGPVTQRSPIFTARASLTPSSAPPFHSRTSAEEKRARERGLPARGLYCCTCYMSSMTATRNSQLAPIPPSFSSNTKSPVGPALTNLFFLTFQYVNLRLFLLLGPHQVTRPGDELRRFNGLLCYQSGTGTSSNSAYSFARSADTTLVWQALALARSRVPAPHLGVHRRALV